MKYQNFLNLDCRAYSLCELSGALRLAGLAKKNKTSGTQGRHSVEFRQKFQTAVFLVLCETVPVSQTSNFTTIENMAIL